MKTHKQLEITQDDIDAGTPYRADSCPINLAAERAFGVPCRTLRTYIMVGDDEHRATLPEEAREWMYRFDVQHAGQFPPFVFGIADPWHGATPTPGELPLAT